MMKKIQFVIVAMLTIMLIGFNWDFVNASTKQNGEKYNFDTLDSYLVQQVQRNRIPGLAIAIVEDDEIVFINGYGNAHPGLPVTPQTQFYLGSTTKSFTALAAMHLVQEGKLDLDKPVQHYLPWFKVADEEASRTITVRQLLNHTSGLSATQDPNVDVYTDTLKEQAQYLQYVSPVAEPGEQFEYYNQNYRVIGCLIEEISGLSYSDYLRQHIFLPLGMKNTVTSPDEAEQLAQGYSRMLGYPVAMEQDYNPGALPSGYIITTAEDMGKYLLVHLNNTVDGDSYLDPILMNQLHTPPTGVDSIYAMGWMKDGDKIAHGGSIYSFQTFMMLDMEKKNGFILLINQNSMQNMMAENANIITNVENFLDGSPIESKDFRWIGWLLSGLILLDIGNHVRLFNRLVKKCQSGTFSKTIWQWLITISGIILPLAILIGLPTLVHQLDGGAPNWYEPFRLMPDLTIWLIAGTSLTLSRNFLKLFLMNKQRAV